MPRMSSSNGVVRPIGYLSASTTQREQRERGGDEKKKRKKKNGGGTMAGNEMTPSSKAAAPPATIRLVNFISEDQARPPNTCLPPLSRSLAGQVESELGRAKPRKKIS